MSGKVKIISFAHSPLGSFVRCIGMDVSYSTRFLNPFSFKKTMGFLFERHEVLDTAVGTKLPPIFYRQFGSSLSVSFTVSRQPRFLMLYRCLPILMTSKFRGCG